MIPGGGKLDQAELGALGEEGVDPTDGVTLNPDHLHYFGQTP